MKKLLTLCALLLGVVGARAVEDETIFLWQSSSTNANTPATLSEAISATGGTATFLGSDQTKLAAESAAYNTAVTDDDLKTAQYGQKLNTNALCLKVTLTGGNKLQANDIIYICGYNPVKVGTSVSSNTAGTELSASLTTGTNSKSDYNVGSIIVPSSIGDNVTEIYISRANPTGTGLAAVKIVRPAPTTDPVIIAEDATIKAKQSGIAATQSITVSGMNLTGSKLTASLSPAVNGLEVSLTEDDITDGAISTTATLSYTETENVKSGTTTLTLSDGTTTKEVTITYLAKVIYSDLETISETTTWDFKTAVTGGVDFSNTGDDKIEYIYADIADFEDLTFTEAFNAKALSFKGQYPFRPGNKFAQNGVLRFKTLYPGEVKVTFSNTGNAADEEANYRYVKVNGVQGEKETYTTTEVTESFYVAAGDVTIEGTNSLRYYTIVFTPSTSINITIDNGKGYRTFASKYPTDWSSVEDVTAYTAKVNGNEVIFEKVTGIIPAGEGLLLKGEDNTYTVPTATTTPDDIENDLVGVIAATEVNGAGIFVLYDGDEGVGFYKTTAETFTVGANTAYLPATISAARTFIALDGETTGVNAVESVEATDSKFFDLQGRQVSKPTKGLYISNGKKYIVK